MKFSRLPSGDYQATRKDGQVITISRLEESLWGHKWCVNYEGDFDGDSGDTAKTKKELVDYENWVEENASEKDLKASNYMG